MKNNLVKKDDFDVFGDEWFNRPFRAMWPSHIFDGQFWDFPVKLNSPKANLVEKDDHYELSLELPGFKKEEIDVIVDNGVISIVANHEESNDEEKDGKKVLVERKQSSMSRSFSFPGVKKEDIKAKLTDGVLEVTIQKTEEEKKELEKVEIE